MAQNLELKDELYYTDLIYEIKSLAGFEQIKDEKTEKRIIEREKSIVEEQETGPFRLLNRLSVFEQELFEIVMEISKKAGVTFRSLSEISKYPELVNEALIELEMLKNELQKIETNNNTSLVKKLISSKSTTNE